MKTHDSNFEDTLNKLSSRNKMSLANVAKLDVTDEELDGYIAFRIRNHMKVEEGTLTYYADENYIFESLKASIPDITKERTQVIISKMERHGFLARKNDMLYSVKETMANIPLK